jgi:tRNA threonylcarbamoyladenosine biosynthesis protein TsaB
MKSNPIILAIETATDACSCALITADNVVLERVEQIPRAHTQLIFPMITELLSTAQLQLSQIEAIAVGRGPGSFTGVRIAVSVAQGLAFGLNIPVYPISTLAALALQGKEQAPNAVLIVPALDARMQEIYSALYQVQDNLLVEIMPEYVGPPYPQDLASGAVALGSGWDSYPPGSNVQWLKQCVPLARHIGLLALAQISQGNPGMLAKEVLPVYVRDNVAAKMAS